jgi:hypothetical protein
MCGAATRSTWVDNINVIVGRRRWLMDDNARVVEETRAPAAVVSEIAWRH